ncbi:MAG TPA: ParB/RepB/Spo0J family partition protein [Bryobacteraceae bacterium]|nr:ParB/RepB/Spo0J family partition protein [Bryobacteraceae bacterium]
MSTAADKPRKALGKGLSALLAPRSPAQPQGDESASAATPAHPSRIPIDAIVPNPVQPRSVFQPDKLEELAASIRANGIIQPLIVRRVGQQYQIVAGERRWRAAKLAGLSEAPVIVQEVADRQMLELALIENVQREDLNPMEMALAYDRLVREMGLSQEEVGRRTGKDRTSIANTIRLLRLPPEVQLLIAEHRLSMGHAKAILGLPSPDQQIQFAEKAAAQGLSVRQIETLVMEQTRDGPRQSRGGKRDTTKDPNVRAAVEQLERVLGTRVRIVEMGEQRGRIEIDYYSTEELDRLFQHLAREQ